MAGSKKKTFTQQAVSLASPVLPAPVAKVAGTRWGSLLFVLLVPFLFATGVLTISWHNGIPTVNFDRARALVVGQDVGERVQQEAVRVAQDVRERQAMSGPQSLGPQSLGPQSSGPQQASPQSEWGRAQPTSWQGQPAYQQPQQSYQQPVYQQPGFQPQGFQQQGYQQQPAAPQWGPPVSR
jgi:hypothetical protein